jgi:hypothetical protein
MRLDASDREVTDGNLRLRQSAIVWEFGNLTGSG